VLEGNLEDGTDHDRDVANGVQTRCGHSRRWAVKSNLTAYGCDVDSLSEIGTKTRAGHARTGYIYVECGTLFVDDDSADRTNGGEDRILSLIGINVLEHQMHSMLSHG
jgi:hypothetical protein